MKNLKELHHSLHDRSKTRWDLHGFRNLLVWLALYLFVAPFLGGFAYAEAAVGLLLLVVLVSSIDAISGSWKLKVAAILVLLVVLALLVMKSMGLGFEGFDASAIGLCVFLSILIYSFCSSLFRVKRVTGNVICSALCLYLVIGMFFGSLFSLLQSVNPESFAGEIIDGERSEHEMTHQFLYLSFVTLSTLGYGDIVPKTRGAGALCQAEAVIGQFMTVVLVARLVGIQVAQETNRGRS